MVESRSLPSSVKWISFFSFFQLASLSPLAFSGDLDTVRERMVDTFCSDVATPSNVDAANKIYNDLNIVPTWTSVTMHKEVGESWYCDSKHEYKHWSCDMDDIDKSVLTLACDGVINGNATSKDRASILLWLSTSRDVYIPDTYRLVFYRNADNWRQGKHTLQTQPFELPLPKGSSPLKLSASNGQQTLNAVIRNTQITAEWQGIDAAHERDWIGLIPEGKNWTSGNPWRFTSGLESGSASINSHGLYYRFKEQNEIKHRNTANYQYSTRNIRRAAAVMAGRLPALINQRVADELYQNSLLDDFYTNNYSPITSNSDYLTTLAEGLLIYPLFFESDRTQTNKILSRITSHFEKLIKPSSKRDAVFKPDHTGHHHLIHYNAYMYSLNSYIAFLEFLDGTKYQISVEDYKNLRASVYAISIMSNSGDEIPSIGGRHPFRQHNSISDESFEHLIRLDRSFGINDGVMKALYDHKKGRGDGNFNAFWQFNHGVLGIYRQEDWLAGMMGCGHSFMCGETSPRSSGKNMYARYQAYGSLMVMYRGDGSAGSSREASGFTPYGRGWDWNRWPGSTSIELPWDKLLQRDITGSEGTAEFNKLDFAGGLRFLSNPNSLLDNGGMMGMFGMDFQQQDDRMLHHDSSFRFKKSAYFFDGKILMLGSNIENTDQEHETITTLFQSHLKELEAPIRVNQTVVDSFPYQDSLISKSITRLLDPNGTGYLVKNSPVIEIERKTQHTPSIDNKNAQESNCGNSTTQAYQNCFNDEPFATAVIKHGKAPIGSAYEYVVLPDSNAKAVETYSGQDYRVLRQDEIAHIVELPNQVTAYTIFSPNTFNDKGAILSSSEQVLVMTQHDTNRMKITVVDPYLNFDYYDAFELNPDTTSEIRLIVKGEWKVEGSDAVKIVARTGNDTTLMVRTKDGLPVDISLRAFPTKNSEDVDAVEVSN